MFHQTGQASVIDMQVLAVWGLGFGVWGLGFGVWGLGFGVWGLGFRVWGLEFWFGAELVCHRSLL